MIFFLVYSSLDIFLLFAKSCGVNSSWMKKYSFSFAHWKLFHNFPWQIFYQKSEEKVEAFAIWGFLICLTSTYVKECPFKLMATFERWKYFSHEFKTVSSFLVSALEYFDSYFGIVWFICESHRLSPFKTC